MRSSVLAVILLLAACGEDPALGESAAELSIPSGIEVPVGNHVVASYRATGYQVYECQADVSGALAWKLRAPIAYLAADDGATVAVHFGGIDVGLPVGPYWQSILDGSRVHGGNAVSSPNPGAIPLLRLQGLDHAGAGLLADVTYIQRLDTTGGLAPTTKCRRNQPKAYIPYTAQYVFWSASLPRPSVPDPIAVPDGHDVAYVGHATGVQIYECVLDATGSGAWKLRAPSAELTDADGDFADHFGGIDAGLPAGPYWKSVRDGSRVHAGSAVSSPNPGAIPFLRLQALDAAGNGVMSRVAFIQRLATTGGVAPTDACTSPDQRAEVPYTADYYFFVPAGAP